MIFEFFSAKSLIKIIHHRFMSIQIIFDADVARYFKFVTTFDQQNLLPLRIIRVCSSTYQIHFGLHLLLFYLHDFEIFCFLDGLNNICRPNLKIFIIFLDFRFIFLAKNISNKLKIGITRRSFLGQPILGVQEVTGLSQSSEGSVSANVDGFEAIASVIGARLSVHLNISGSCIFVSFGSHGCAELLERHLIVAFGDEATHAHVSYFRFIIPEVTITLSFCKISLPKFILNRFQNLVEVIDFRFWLSHRIEVVICAATNNTSVIRQETEFPKLSTIVPFFTKICG